MRNKGFTLVELLAVIVILAVISLIATPLILGVIEKANKSAAENGTLSFLDALEKIIISSEIQGKIVSDGTYSINGNFLNEQKIEYKGRGPVNGRVIVENRQIKYAELYIMGYSVNYLDGKAEIVDEDYNKNYSDTVSIKLPICKRAKVETLHEETCEQNDSQKYCSGAGYKNGDMITYGNKLVTAGVLNSGDAFDCDINGDGLYDAKTERFYYVSDYYNTKTNEFENDTAILIYYDNISNDMSAYYSLAKENWHGPIDLITLLPTVEEWSNVKLKNTTRSIINEFGDSTANGKELPTDFNYSKNGVDLAARLLNFKELSKSCKVTEAYTIGTLDKCNYLLENTTYALKSTRSIESYFLETPVANANIIFRIYGTDRTLSTTYPTSLDNVRPVIEVLKIDMSY